MHIDRRYSFALAEAMPDGISDGCQSIPRVYEVISRTSSFAKRQGLKYALEANSLPVVVVKGIRLKLITLNIGQQYLFYRDDPEGRGAYFIPKEHGRDDGYFGSTLSLLAPDAISAKTSLINR